MHGGSFDFFEDTLALFKVAALVLVVKIPVNFFIGEAFFDTLDLFVHFGQLGFEGIHALVLVCIELVEGCNDLVKGEVLEFGLQLEVLQQGHEVRVNHVCAYVGEAAFYIAFVVMEFLALYHVGSIEGLAFIANKKPAQGSIVVLLLVFVSVVVLLGETIDSQKNFL